MNSFYLLLIIIICVSCCLHLISGSEVMTIPVREKNNLILEKFSCCDEKEILINCDISLFADYYFENNKKFLLEISKGDEIIKKFDIIKTEIKTKNFTSTVSITPADKETSITCTLTLTAVNSYINTLPNKSSIITRITSRNVTSAGYLLYCNSTTTTKTPPTNTNSQLPVILSVAICGLFIIVVAVIIFVWKNNSGKKLKKSKKDDLISQEMSITTKEEPSVEWEFPRHRLRIFNIIGEGAFGQVFRAQAIDIDGKKGETTVAVKTLKENASQDEKTDLIQELNLMKSLGTHPNVIRLIACCTEKEPILVIMEFVSIGKLQQFLRDSRAGRHYGNTHGDSRFLTSSDLTHFAYEVARGMDFLSSKGIIHRDLAARNVLITEERTCKVADFGLARDVTGSLVYERKSGGRLPLRWMAPESLCDDIFSAKSDVWSFGVLLWEIVTLGSTPYPGWSAGYVMQMVRDGYRLEKPEHCRRELYNIMYYCWEADPNSRPDFKEVVNMLERLICTETDYIELEMFPDHLYYNIQHLDGEKL